MGTGFLKLLTMIKQLKLSQIKWITRAIKKTCSHQKSQKIKTRRNLMNLKAMQNASILKLRELETNNRPILGRVFVCIQ